MNIAIIGAGVSGLVAAYRLCRQHRITVFESHGKPGGHANTVDVDDESRRLAIDTGFIVYNDWTYPNFVQLLEELGIASQPTEMSFSVRDDRTGLEYNGHSLPTLFAQRSNLLRPRFYRMLKDILRFNREAPRRLADVADDMTVEEFLEQGGYSRQFVEHYLLPMGAAIWSCPTGIFARFPIRFIIEFYSNHGLLNLMHRPTWRVIQGGSRTYVEALTARFRDRIRLHTPVRSVRRTEDRVDVQPSGSDVESFDHVVFACHSDQALRILGADATPVERELLGAFPYSRNNAVLHTDTSLLPRTRRAWASWNYRVTGDETTPASVTYNMNILQGLRSSRTFCVTLNGESRIDPDCVLRRFEYHHPVFTTQRAAAQARHADLLLANRSSFCGAYWGNGFHEDGVNSALAVCHALGAIPFPPWRRHQDAGSASMQAGRERVQTREPAIRAGGGRK